MPTTPSSKYRPEIDGLRAFAVVAVIINHFNKDLLPSGYLGVDIFFVISGYVITSSLAGRESKNFLDFLSGFYERRIKRLVPALVVFVLITSVLISLFNPDPGVALKTGITSLFGLSNLYLLKTSTDYFAQSTELNPFVHTWSLGVEEQFYLLFPFLIWFSGFGRQTAKGARNLFFWVGALTIASLIGFIYLYQVNQPAAYFLMPTRLWEMAAGCLVFIGFLKRARIEQALEQIPPLLVVAAMVGVMYLPVAAAVPATIGIVVLSAVLIACLKKGTTAYQFFTLEKVVYIGLISYSLYLWHWTVLSISRWTIGIHWWSVPIQIGVMLGLAMLSYAKIETPIRKTKRQIARTLAIVGGVGILASTALSASGVAPQLIQYAKRYASKIALPTSNPVILSTWWHDKEGRYIEYCHVKGEFSKQIMINCLGSSSSTTKNQSTGFLLGDSHARNYLIAAKNAFPEHTIKYLTMGYGCAFLPDSMISESIDSTAKCAKYVEEASKYVRKLAKPGDVVFIGQALRDGDFLARSTPEYFSHIEAFANHLHDTKVPVVIFDGTYPPGKQPELCSKELWRPFPNYNNCQKPISANKMAYWQFDSKAHELARRSQNIFYAPLRAGLCSSETCGQYTLSGAPIWHDNGHITEAASGELAGLLRKVLREGGFFDYSSSAQ
ncbi:acyltransferase [Cyanobium sp. BA20m-14]|uniref:acyltransferase family protein n=1 Tax=Cyanobium sp. BA20m-14 TaxID=2823703 RepID=UPI0020CEB364|nr:acyltransferase family protein [Cyanobium sp. BA20m-14]MCP9911907.1 acyltransferase [Cyanobium sp. BA20m-14]